MNVLRKKIAKSGEGTTDAESAKSKKVSGRGYRSSPTGKGDLSLGIFIITKT